jgi:hypothetical protein
MRHSRLFPVLSLSILACFARTASAANVTVIDIFGRDITANGIVLVDWEGHLADPALKINIKPPAGTAFPATATPSANGARLYFDLPCDVGPNGPQKSISFPNEASSTAVLISIFPDHDGVDEDYTLNIALGGSATQTKVPIHVIDQDQPTNTRTFKIAIDFCPDQTWFYADRAKRAIVQQCADDWAYFIDGTQFDSVPAGHEKTFIRSEWICTGKTRPIHPHTRFCSCLRHSLCCVAFRR